MLAEMRADEDLAGRGGWAPRTPRSQGGWQGAARHETDLLDIAVGGADHVDTMVKSKNLMGRAGAEALDESMRRVLAEAVQARRADPEFRSQVQQIIEEDRELLERLAG